MRQSYYIQGIKCMSCVGKITALLENELTATEVVFSENNTRLEFSSQRKEQLDTLNQHLKTLGGYSLSEQKSAPTKAEANSASDATSYKPIYLIFGYLILINIVISLKTATLDLFMPNFMAGFFLVFSFFKLLDLNGFANGYSSYDLLAKKFYRYGYVYPFLELGFGILYLLTPFSLFLNFIVFVIMLISAIGVIKAKLSKQKFYCACVGTFLKVPLGSIAIIEDVLMVLMSLLMIIHLI